MTNKVPKTVNTIYQLRKGEATLSQFEKLADARKALGELPADGAIQLVKVSQVELVLASYSPTNVVAWSKIDG